jgi:hypothetical protein
MVANRVVRAINMAINREVKIRVLFPKMATRGGKEKKFPKKGDQSLQYCSLCGAVDHLASSGCINMRDDKGAHVNIMPTHGTCNMCPMSVNPRLNHPTYLCPWRPGGPFSSN